MKRPFGRVLLSHMWAGFIRMRLDRLEEYGQDVEGLLRKAADGIAAKAERDMAGLEPIEAERESERWGEDYQQVAQEHPATHRSLLLVGALSLFEHALTILNSALERDLGLPPRKSSRSRGTMECLDALKTKFGLVLPDSADWKKLKDFMLIRNAFVHAQGELNWLKEGRASTTFEALERRRSGAVAEPVGLGRDDRMRYSSVELKPDFIHELFGTLRSLVGDLEAAARDRVAVAST